MESFEEYTQRLLDSDPEFKVEFDQLGPRFAAITQLIRARNTADISQSELARRMHVNANAISRLESGAHSPRVDTLAAAARALGYEFRVSFVKAKPSRTQAATTRVSSRRKVAPATRRRR